MTDAGPSLFRTLYEGRLSGLLKWEQVDALFHSLAQGGADWYLYDTREALPATTLSGPALSARLRAIRDWAFERNRRDALCGCVFVDDRASPQLVKIYDPLSGSSCSVKAPLPLYTVSAMAPETLPFDAAPSPFDDAEGRSLFDRLFGAKA